MLLVSIPFPPEVVYRKFQRVFYCKRGESRIGMVLGDVVYNAGWSGDVAQLV